MTEFLIPLFVLIILELILGIDNLIFVNIIIDNAEPKYKKRLRVVWASIGIITRSILLFGLSWLLAQKGKPILTIYSKSFDLASIVMLLGGLFLIYKTVLEIHNKTEGGNNHIKQKKLSFSQAIIQIVLIDAVFSFDSVITAGGTAKQLWVMITAVSIAMICMFYFSEKIGDFIHKRPTFKVLALSFLVMIGFTLLIEGWDHHIAETTNLKNYVYFAMAFSFGVETLNQRVRK